jgi:hypothetical protein
MTKILLPILLSALALTVAAQQPKDDPESAAPLQHSMEHMRELMDRIHATSDPVEKRRLMDEHMSAMHETMGMMRGMSAGEMPSCNQGDTACEMRRMQGQHQGMQRRMDMMQGMMGQMMEHMMQRGAAAPPAAPAAPTPAPAPGEPKTEDHAAHH